MSCRKTLLVVSLCLTLTSLGAAVSLGEIQVCYYSTITSFQQCQINGQPVDGPVFIFQNTSGAPITNAVFYINGDGYQDSFNVGTVPPGTYVAVTPGLSNDGGMNHTFFQYTGTPRDTSDVGPNGDDVQFWLLGQQGVLHVTSGVFTPGQTAGPSNDGTVSYINFLGGPGDADGPCNNCFGPKVVAMLAGVAPNTLLSFGGPSDGANPSAGLTIDASGTNLYGMASAGGTGSCVFDGTPGCGTVFRLNRRNGNWLLTPLYKFLGGIDGELPLKPLTIGPNGSLYGMTASGGEGTCVFDGDTGCGIVFNVTPMSTVPANALTPWLQSVLYRFTGETDAGNPSAMSFSTKAGICTALRTTGVQMASELFSSFHPPAEATGPKVFFTVSLVVPTAPTPLTACYSTGPAICMAPPRMVGARQRAAVVAAQSSSYRLRAQVGQRE